MTTRHTKVLGRLLILCSIAAAPALARDKTDVIVLLNGDRITGEIKQLEYGLLQLSTDNMGTINIEWNAIQSIESDFTFDVERSGGQRYAGVIATSEDGQNLVVQDQERAESVPLSAVTRVSELETRFWQRVSGSFSLGIQLHEVERDPNRQPECELAVPRAEGQVDTRHQHHRDLESRHRAHIPRADCLYSAVPQRAAGFSNVVEFGGAQRRARHRRRLQSGAAIARYFLQGADREVMALTGVVANKEWTSGVDDELSSLEAVFGAQYRIFRFSDPEISLSSSAYLYPSLTESGRRRGNLDISLRREIISDLFFDISLYESYDSDPPAEGTTTDYGIVTSLGYKF